MTHAVLISGSVLFLLGLWSGMAIVFVAVEFVAVEWEDTSR